LSYGRIKILLLNYTTNDIKLQEKVLI